MKSVTIKLQKGGYEPFIDFIKAFAILAVLLGHTFPYLEQTGYALWYGMQVPLFILIQVFHVFKKENYQLNVSQLIKRIFLPYFVVQSALFVALFLHGNDINRLMVAILNGGGIGPGSYYPWIYLQFAILLPLVKPLFDKGSKIELTVICLLICESLEIISSFIGLPDSLHRILAIRYLFLINLGWLWVKEGIVLNTKTILLSLLSMATIIYFEYFYIPTEPWFYDTAWKTHRWPCYFYVSTMLCMILYYFYHKTIKYQVIDKCVKMLARCSYEIFLVQMFVIQLYPTMDSINNKAIRFGIRFIPVWILCIVGGYYFNKMQKKMLK